LQLIYIIIVTAQSFQISVPIFNRFTIRHARWISTHRCTFYITAAKNDSWWRVRLQPTA